MNCNSGKRKLFADELIASVSELAKKHGLKEMIVRRESDPVMIAARGCLEGDDKDDEREAIELVVHVSPNLSAAERLSLEGAEMQGKVPDDISQAFDLSEVVAVPSVARAAPLQERDDRCAD